MQRRAGGDRGKGRRSVWSGGTAFRADRGNTARWLERGRIRVQNRCSARDHTVEYIWRSSTDGGKLLCSLISSGSGSLQETQAAMSGEYILVIKRIEVGDELEIEGFTDTLYSRCEWVYLESKSEGGCGGQILWKIAEIDKGGGWWILLGTRMEKEICGEKIIVGLGESWIMNNGLGVAEVKRPDAETVFLKAMAETGQIKLYGEQPTLTETALYRARKHLYKEETLQAEHERLGRDGPVAYYSQRVKAWKKRHIT
ncbi:protein plastid transcriptionally active 12, chloroplastic [Tanacetum coccineum]